VNAPTPGSAEWLRIVTASKVAAIIGVSPWESPRSMWHKMRGDVDSDTRTSDAMERGNLLEPAVIAWWLSKHPEVVDAVEQSYMVHPDHPWAAATLDLWVLNQTCEEIVEVKTASRMDDWGTPGTDAIPTHYLTQVYWQLAVTPQAARARIAVLGPFLEFSEYVVERDEEIQADLIARCAAFYASLDGDVPPDLDNSVATFDVIKRLHPDIDAGTSVEVPFTVALDYIIASDAAKDAAARETGAKSALLDAMGNARIATCSGVKFARRQPNRYGVSLVKTATVNDLTGDLA
jgi:putative phage-type endonuclease